MFSLPENIVCQRFFLDVKEAYLEDLHYECDLKIDFKIARAFRQFLFERIFKYEEQCRSLIVRAFHNNWLKNTTNACAHECKFRNWKQVYLLTCDHVFFLARKKNAQWLVTTEYMTSSTRTLLKYVANADIKELCSRKLNFTRLIFSRKPFLSRVLNSAILW